ncbi:hypothetical protein L6452_05951 [Arctium lappa]|uniref:Uncharacterized protein n=1 Tax=Arctium lappa TaxID=4217 RepID=A0ACB9EI98_ARCLA|nr:hypothetical protein L6452_05951 [Arctium lappa]
MEIWLSLQIQISDVSSITLEDALQLLRYPITLGKHPDDGQPVVLKLARAGLSVKHRRTQAPVPKVHQSQTWLLGSFVTFASKFGVSTTYFSLFTAATQAFLGPPSLLDGKITRSTAEDFCRVPEWVPFESDIVYRLHEVIKYTEGAIGNESGVSDTVRVEREVAEWKETGSRDSEKLQRRVVYERLGDRVGQTCHGFRFESDEKFRSQHVILSLASLSSFAQKSFSNYSISSLLATYSSSHYSCCRMKVRTGIPNPFLIK